MHEEFPIQGAKVDIADLLKLQTLAIDLKRLTHARTRSRRAGDQRSVFRGQGREFIEMKHYQTGDDVRQIDWRQTAKKQSPYVRVMEEDRHSEHTIWLDLSSSSYFGTKKCFKSVVACQWAAFLVWRFLQLNHPIRLFIRVGNEWQKELKITAQNQGAQACQLITEAHQYLADNFKTLSKTNGAPVSHWSGRPNLWFISDFLQLDSKQLQNDIPLHSISSLTLLQVIDVFDQQLPDAGILPVKNDSSSGTIATNNKLVKQQYVEQFKLRNKSLEEFSWQIGGTVFSHLSHEFHWREAQNWPLYH